MKKSKRLKSFKKTPTALKTQVQQEEQLQKALEVHRQGNLAQAIAQYQLILTEQPKHFDAMHLMGVAAHQLKNNNLAEEKISQAIAIYPFNPAFHSNKGLVLADLGKPEEALTSYDNALCIRPDYAEAYNNKSILLNNLKQFEKTIEMARRAITLKHDYVHAYNNLSISLSNLHLNKEAIESCNKAIVIQPDFAELYNNKGTALQEMDQLEAATKSYRQAIRIAPNYLEALSNLGNVLCRCRAFEEAIYFYDQAINIDSHYVDAYWNKSIALLLMGDWEAGWSLYEWRLKSKKIKAQSRSFECPRWCGEESLNGKKILIYSEQGLGDTIQFCRFVKRLAALGAMVFLEIPRALMTLLKNLEGVSQLIAQGAIIPEVDFHCPLMSLPLAFKTTQPTLPAPRRYIESDPHKVKWWKEKLGAPNKKMRVGLVWSGGFRADQPDLWSANERRNVALRYLTHLKDLEVEFISLQKGESAQSELKEIQKNGWAGPEIKDYVDDLEDFSDTAALIENVDLVISVDTSTAHLAAALGKPVWILNRYDTCWRWLLDTQESVWYPTVKLYRQESDMNWEAVLEKVNCDLQKLILNRP